MHKLNDLLEDAKKDVVSLYNFGLKVFGLDQKQYVDGSTTIPGSESPDPAIAEKLVKRAVAETTGKNLGGTSRDPTAHYGRLLPSPSAPHTPSRSWDINTDTAEELLTVIDTLASAKNTGYSPNAGEQYITISFGRLEYTIYPDQHFIVQSTDGDGSTLMFSDLEDKFLKVLLKWAPQDVKDIFKNVTPVENIVSGEAVCTSLLSRQLDAAYCSSAAHVCDLVNSPNVKKLETITPNATGGYTVFYWK